MPVALPACLGRVAVSRLCRFGGSAIAMVAFWLLRLALDSAKADCYLS